MTRRRRDAPSSGPDTETRIVFHADGHPQNHLPLHPKEEDLYEYVDHLAEGEVDLFSLASFISVAQEASYTGGSSPAPPSSGHSSSGA